MRNGQESERDRLLAMMLMDEDRIYAQTVARRVPFAHHRPLRDELINGHARRRRNSSTATRAAGSRREWCSPTSRAILMMPTACPWEAHVRRYSRRRMPPACQWEVHVRR